MAAFGAYGWAYLALGRLIIGTANLTAAICALGLHAWVFSAPSPSRVSRTIHLAAALGLTTFMVAARASGGGASMPVWYLTLVPVFVAFVHDRRATAIWACVAAAGIVGVGVIGSVVPSSPEFTAGTAEVTAGQLSLALLLAVMALASRTAAEQQIAELANLGRQIEAQAASLVEARDAALASSRAKSEFLARMSHEIRTPLNGVIGMASLLHDGEPHAARREQLETIRTSGETLRAVIDEILDFSRIESGHLELVARPFDLRGCVERALEIGAPAAALKGLELACTIGPGVPLRVVGDEMRLRQVLVNLVGNAIKFTEQGGVLVTVDVPLPRGQDARELHIAVRDTGIGIAAERFGELFQPFSQLDGGADARHQGSGLGLAITARVVALMQGAIYVRSVIGKGSRFYVDLPLVAAHATRSRRSRLDDVVAGTRILLIEPRELTRRSLGTLLEDLGALVRTTDSAAHARALLSEEPTPDVVVVSHAVADAARLDDWAPGIPRIRIGRLGEPAGTASATEHMVEPMRRDALVQALGRALERPERSAPPSSNAAAAPSPPPRLRILLVEDNAINQRVATLMLDQLGHEVEIAADGVAAVEAAIARRFDAILMDVRLPGVDGAEATRRIRGGLAAELQPWIIACTANVLESDRADCMHAGMDDFLAKPIELAELDARLRLVGASRPVTPVDVPPASSPTSGEPIEAGAIARLRLLCNGDPAVLADLIRSHVANSRELRAQAGEALRLVDRQTLQRAAHTLKSSTAMFGAGEVARRAAELEAQALTGSIEALAAGLAGLATVHDAACDALERQTR